MAEPTSQSSLLDELLGANKLAEWAESSIRWAQTHLLTVDVVIQVFLIMGALIPAVLLGPRIRKTISEHLMQRVPHGMLRRLVDAAAELATPLALYLTLTAIEVALGSVGQPQQWVAAALALLTAWIAVRLVTLVIRSAFWSRVAFYIAWPIAALDAFGALGPVIEQLRELAIPLGQSDSGQPIRITLLDVIRTLFYFAILFWGANALSGFLQSRINNTAELSPSLKAMINKILNILLPVVALVIALQIAGFNLATLAVFSGAVGLGIGLGLQRIASNFIAGFTLIADKSIKPGDVIEIDDTFGWVTAMQARYVAIRTRDGTEMLIPNDRFISEGVTNWSRSDKVVRQHAPFGVSYKTRDVRAVQALAVEAAKAVERVVDEPQPVCNLVAYGDSSVDFDLRFWITDPQNGLANVRSQVYVELWDKLHENDVEIPFPQRDLHVKSWEADTPPEEPPGVQ